MDKHLYKSPGAQFAQGHTSPKVTPFASFSSISPLRSQPCRHELKKHLPRAQRKTHALQGAPDMPGGPRPLPPATAPHLSWHFISTPQSCLKGRAVGCQSVSSSLSALTCSVAWLAPHPASQHHQTAEKTITPRGPLAPWSHEAEARHERVPSPRRDELTTAPGRRPEDGSVLTGAPPLGF